MCRLLAHPRRPSVALAEGLHSASRPGHRSRRERTSRKGRPVERLVDDAGQSIARRTDRSVVCRTGHPCAALHAAILSSLSKLGTTVAFTTDSADPSSGESQLIVCSLNEHRVVQRSLHLDNKTVEMRKRLTACPRATLAKRVGQRPLVKVRLQQPVTMAVPRRTLPSRDGAPVQGLRDASAPARPLISEFPA